MILCWPDYESLADFNRLPRMSAEQILPLVEAWLQSDEANAVQLTGWDTDCDHDGYNELGWRVYVEDWGHVPPYSGTICAITPAYMWYGK